MKGVNTMSLKIAIIPVILTVITNIITNVIYDSQKRKSESRKKYALDQLKELYLPLYSIISQSEYIRYFFEMKNPFEEIPFNELHKTTTNLHVDNNGKSKITVVESEDEITVFNKKNIDKLIISKSQYASLKLIKLAVAHRYLEDNYLNDHDDRNLSNKFADDEVKILANLIKLIIKETNRLLKYCGMKYDRKELKSGYMNAKIYNSKKVKLKQNDKKV